MTDTAEALASKLIRNWNDAKLTHEVRAPLYDSLAARLLGVDTDEHKLDVIQRPGSTLDYWEGKP